MTFDERNGNDIHTSFSSLVFIAFFIPRLISFAIRTLTLNTNSVSPSKSLNNAENNTGDGQCVTFFAFVWPVLVQLFRHRLRGVANLFKDFVRLHFDSVRSADEIKVYFSRNSIIIEKLISFRLSNRAEKRRRRSGEKAYIDRLMVNRSVLLCNVMFALHWLSFVLEFTLPTKRLPTNSNLFQGRFPSLFPLGSLHRKNR